MMIGQAWLNESRQARNHHFLLAARAAMLTAALFCSIFAAPQAFAQEWPRLDDGRVVVTIKGVRLALPTDEASVQEFHFRRARDGFKSEMELREVIANPELARRLFDEWQSVIAARRDNPNYGGRFLWSSGTPEQRASRENLNNGNYRVTVGGRNVIRRCSNKHAGWVFIYGNITAPLSNPITDRSNYMGCAGESVEVGYGSLNASDWTHDTLPILQKNITDLFNEILMDQSVEIYEYDRRACEKALNSPEMQGIEIYIDNHLAAVQDLINEKLAGLDCQWGQLRRYLIEQDFVIDRSGESSEGYWIRVYYNSPKGSLLSKLFEKRLDGLFVFDENRTFTYTNWFVPK